MKNLNEYLQTLRTEQKMSQVEVAKGFQKRGYSVSNQMIYNWESGRNNISGEMLLVLCDILNISDIRGAFDRNEIPSLTSSLNNDGEIGIFFHNGEGFIKKLGHKDGKILLISLNHRKYEPREIKEDDIFFVFGKVVG